MNWEITKCPFFFERGDVLGVNRPRDDRDDVPLDDLPLLRPRGWDFCLLLDLLELDLRDELDLDELDFDLLLPRCFGSFGARCLLFR